MGAHANACKQVFCDSNIINLSSFDFIKSTVFRSDAVIRSDRQRVMNGDRPKSLAPRGPQMRERWATNRAIGPDQLSAKNQSYPAVIWVTPTAVQRYRSNRTCPHACPPAAEGLADSRNHPSFTNALPSERRMVHHHSMRTQVGSRNIQKARSDVGFLSSTKRENGYN
jgi:hypothetical protein